MIKTIAKTILLWVTALVVLLTILGLPSIFEHPITLLLCVLSSIILVTLCREYISERELYILSGTKFLENIWGKE
jgi:hypothetical protein